MIIQIPDLTYNISEYREILLGIEWIIVFFCFEFFILFFSRYNQRKSKKMSIVLSNFLRNEDRSARKVFEEYMNLLVSREIAWGIVFFFLGWMYFMFIISDFYANTNFIREIFLDAGYLLFVCAIITIGYSIERNELRKTNFLFSKIFGSLLIVLLLAILFWDQGVQYILILFWPFIFIMFYQAMGIMLRRAHGIHRLILPTYSLIAGLFFLILGFFFSTDYIILNYGIIFRLIGDLIQFGAVALCAVSFYFLPSFSEYDWIEKIRAIFIIHPSGILLFNYDFRGENNQSYESDLTSSAIVAIKSLIEDMAITGKKIESVKKEGFTMLLEYGRHIFSVLLADEDTASLREKNHAFCEDFEKNFPDARRFYGNVDKFKDADKIIKKIFVI